MQRVPGTTRRSVQRNQSMSAIFAGPTTLMPALTPRVSSPPRNLKRRRAIRTSPEQTVNEYGPDAARTASALAAVTNHPDITAEQLQLMSTLAVSKKMPGGLSCS